jgi:hypothetical protein
MACRRERAHIGPELSEDHLRCDIADAGKRRQPLGGVMKGHQRGLDPRIECCHRRLQLLNHPQMLTNQEATVWRDLPFEGLLELRPRAFEP